MNSFYMTLLSDSSQTVFPDNTNYCFRTKLPKQISISKEEWEVAVVELILPSQIKNVTEEESHFSVVSTDEDIIRALNELQLPSEPKEPLGVRLSIPAGKYNSATELLDEMDKQITERCRDVFTDHAIVFNIRYSEVARRIKFANNSHERVGLGLHPNLRLKLGVKADMMDENMFPGFDSFPHTPDLNMGYNFLFIYSDIVDHTFFGDVEAPLLRVIPYNPADTESLQQHKEFLNLHYVPVTRSFFDKVAVYIMGETGKEGHFENGKSLVKLHFRRKPRFPL